ncbi:hypothetical protein ACQ4PT_056954 [Festuca glaucescens]
MALGQEAAEQLWQELIGGYSLNARLLALLEHPLDILGQEAAKAMSQELSRVFMVSLFTLKPGDSIRVAGLRTMAPEATGIGQGSPAKDKHIWLYYSCRYSHERGCRAKKQVQRQDSSSDAHRPMFHVTFVNQHTCHQVRPSRNISNNATNSPTMNTTATRNGAHFDHAVHVGGNAQLENQIMTGTFARVIGGATSRPQPVEASELSDPASYAPPGLLEVSMSLEHGTTVAEMRGGGLPFPPPVEAPTAPYSSSSLPHTVPVEASPSDPAGGGHSQSASLDSVTMEEMFFSYGQLLHPVEAHSISQYWDDVPMAVAGRYRDKASASAWP